MIDAKGCLVVRPIDGDSGNLEEWGEAPWEKHADSIASVKIEKDVIASTARDMFYGCSSLASLDLSGLDTSDVTDMSGMFRGCSSLTYLDVSGFNTSKAANMSDMFSGCSSLASLDLLSFDTSKAENMGYMFYGCSGLRTIALGSGFDFKDGDRLPSPQGDDLTGRWLSSADGIAYEPGSVPSGVAATYNAQRDGDTAWNQFVTCLWNVDDEGNLVVKPLSEQQGSLDNGSGYCDAPWGDMAGDIKTVSFQEGKIVAPAHIRGMFSGCSSLASLDLSGFDTSGVVDMSFMFSGCSSLASLDLSGFDTANVKDMVGMFRDCSKLEKINLSSFNTANVKGGSDYYDGGMSFMFYNCSSLTSLDLSTFDTTNVTSTYNMFYGCSGLRTVVFGTGFDFKVGEVGPPNQGGLPSPQGDGLTGRWVSSADGVAYEPSGVPSGVAATYRAQRDGDGAWNQYGTCVWRIDADGRLEIEPLPGRESGELADWGYGKAPWLAFATEIKEATVGDGVAAATAGGMFRGCASMVSADLSQLDTSGVTDTSHMFYGCSSLVSLDLSHFNTSSVTSMSGMFSGCSSLTSLDLSSFDTSKVKNMGAMYEPDRGEGMFSGCSSLESLDLSSFNTPAAVCMSFMFYGCSSLASLDLSGFGTSAPAKLSSMFYGCSSLKAIKFAGSGKLRVSTSSSMFYGCSKLAELDLSSFDTSNATSTSGMFSGCSSLASLDLACLDTSNVTSMSHMFSGCSSLASLDLSSFDTSKVTSMDSMFSGCSKLTSLDLSSFNTSSVKEDSRSKGVMTRMFSGCLSLESLNLSSFDTSKVRCMDGMFEGCLRLKDVNLSSFNFSNATSMSYMFQNCQSLEAIEFPDSFDTSKVTGFSSMFSGCRSLERLDVSRFDTSAATSLEFMFSGCSKLAFLDVSGFKVSGNAYIGSMFSGCSSLTSLDLSGFDTSGIASAYGMSGLLTGCDGLRAVTLGPKFSFEGAGLDRQCSLPTPTGDGLTGRWVSSIDGASYAPDGVPSNIAATYTAQVKGGISKTAISESMFTVDTSARTYTGLQIMPEVLSSKNLQKGVDYAVFYGPNVNAGTGTVTVSGVGNYTGTLSYSFTIEKAAPEYTAPGPISATEGQTLGDLELPDGFSWQDELSASVGEAGEHEFMARFTPSDAANYNTVENIAVKVNVAARGDADGWIACGDCAWRVDDQGCLVIKPANGVSGTLENFTTLVENDAGNLMRKAPWEDYSDRITSARFEKGVAAGPDLGCIFWQLCKLERVDFSNLDMSNVKTMGDAFRCCESLKEVDGLGAEGGMALEDATEMFSLCRSLEKVDLSDVDLSAIESAGYMFSGCSSLKQIDLSGLGSKSSRCRYLSGMFYDCSSLKSLDLSCLDTRNVAGMKDMFLGCTSLSYVKLGENFSFSGSGSERLCSLPTPWEGGSTGLWRDAEGRTFAPSEVPDGAGTYTAVFPELPDGWKAIGGCSWKVDGQGRLVIKPTNGESGELAEWGFDYDSGKASTPWRETASEITSVVVEDGVVAPLRIWGMFEGCSNLVSADLRKLDVPGASNLRSMFSGCSSLKTVALPEGGVPQIDDLRYAFAGCSSLESVDLSAFKGSTASNSMEGAFLGCSSLRSVDLSGLDTSKIANMDDLFLGCSSLESVALSGMDTSSVNTMKRMFDGCVSLESVTLGEGFTFNGSGAERQCSLPTLGGAAHTGKWIDVATWKAYAADAVPDNTAATYRAQRKLLGSDFDVDVSDAVYSGDPVVGRVSSSTLKEGVDYDVAYSGNVDAGTASVSIVGKGLYAGELVYSFKISQARITADMISGIPEKMEATGEQLRPDPVVTFNGRALKKGKDYAVSYGTNVNPGKGSVTVAAAEGGNFTGSATVEFDIEKKAEPDPGTGGGGGGIGPAPTPDPGTGGGSGGGEAPAPEPQQFSVTYHLDGGVNAASNPATYTAGTVVALAAPTKEGCEFRGWYADAEFKARVTEIPTDATGDVELWAKWAKKTAPAPVFSDVDYSQWYGGAVTYVAGRGLITGYAGTTLFGVGDTLTRAQLATILWRNACPGEAAAYDPASAKDETGMAGSADGQYYTAAANWAVKNGVISGYDRSDGSKDFAAGDDVTFEQLVTILARLCAAPGELASAGTNLSAFADGADASPWSRAAFAWAAGKGLVEGYDTASGKLLAPGEDVARERVAVVLMRAFEMGLLK